MTCTLCYAVLFCGLKKGRLCVYLRVPDQELSDLDDWPEALQPEASQVETSADKLKRKYWWKNIEV